MNSNPLFSNVIKKGSQVINYQSVRWRRPKKPFWLGIAKSKMFVVPEPKVDLTPEESKLHEQLLIKYNTHLKSIKNFICNESPRWKNIAETDEEEKLKISPELQEKINASFITNEKWNAESLKLGQEYAEKALEMEAEKAEMLIKEENARKQEHLRKLNEIVAKEKALSENYITQENLAEAIEKSINTVEEFDFAIDLEGNKYFGRQPLETKRPKVETANSMVFSENNMETSEFAPERL